MALGRRVRGGRKKVGKVVIGFRVLLSNRHYVQIVDRVVVSEIRGHQRTSPLTSRCRDPGIRGLNRPTGAPALIHDGGPDRTRAFIGIEGQIRRCMLFESLAAGHAPIVECGPQKQFSASHEGNYQLMIRYHFSARPP